MKYTKNQLDIMQRYVIGVLNMQDNHTYPQEEVALNLLLVMIADQRIENDSTKEEFIWVY